MTFTPPPLVEGVYNLDIKLCAWISVASSGGIGSTFDIEGAVKCDGAGGLATIGTPIRDMDGESPPFDVTLVTVSVAGGVIDVVVTGIAGKTIKWTGLMTYEFGGV